MRGQKCFFNPTHDLLYKKEHAIQYIVQETQDLRAASESQNFPWTARDCRLTYIDELLRNNVRFFILWIFYLFIFLFIGCFVVSRYGPLLILNGVTRSSGKLPTLHQQPHPLTYLPSNMVS